MNKILITSDQHFGHTNIIKYCNRPFSSAKDMDDYMISKWNGIANKDDLIYHLGDFALVQPARKAELLSQLNGIKILIQGNHDRNSNKMLLECGFKEICKYKFLDWIIKNYVKDKKKWETVHNYI